MLDNSNLSTREMYAEKEEVYEREGKYRELKDMYLEVLRSTHLTLSIEEIGITYYRLGLVCADIGSEKEAEGYFRESVKKLNTINTENAEAMDAMASSLYNIYVLTEEESLAIMAERVYNKVIDKCPDYEQERAIYLNLSDLYLRLKRFDDALAYCRKAARLSDSDEERIHDSHAEAITRHCRKEYATARELYDKSLHLAKQDIRLHTKLYSDLARLYLDMGEPSQAIVMCRLSLERLKDCPWLRDKGSYLRELNALMEACQEAK